MKRLIATSWISLDGRISGPNGELDWVLGDSELAAYETNLMAGADTILLGRRTHEMLAPYWTAIPTNPQAQDWEKPYAKKINAAHHVVVSHDLTDANWGRSTIWRDIDKAAVDGLKQGSGAILTFGSASVVQRLLALGVVDELHLLIHPTVLGGGTRLLDNVASRIRFERISLTPYASGVLQTAYRPT